MTNATPGLYTAFNGQRRLASGPMQAITSEVKRAMRSEAASPILVFEDATGRVIDIDLRDSGAADVQADSRDNEPRGRGRPKLGVVPREVTLLPRHWEWLATQPGGASVALRKLVEAAGRANDGSDTRRKAQERAYHFMLAMAGDMPGFEEATRALFANDEQRMRERVAVWPEDVRNYALALAFGSPSPAS